MADKDPIRIVQLSDLHLYADQSKGLYGLNSFHAFQQVLASVDLDRCDLMLLSGDLVHDESEAGYRLLQQELAAVACRVVCLPGNHDKLSLMESLYHSEAMSCNKVIQTGNWQLLLLNSTVVGEVGGSLADTELQFLEQALQEQPDLHALVVLHHQPLPVGSKWLDQVGLDNSDALLGIVAAHPQVKGVVWGHVHQEYDEERAGVRFLATPSTCIQFMPGADDFELDLIPPGYRWLELYSDGTLRTGVERLAAIPGEVNPRREGY